jgi:copper binding plastocyanin/azurin family protein
MSPDQGGSYVPRRLLVTALAAAATLLPAGAGLSSAQQVTLNAEVGPGFTISLRNPDGSPVTHLDPGTYHVAVNDQGIEHNFHLFGEGVDMRTVVETTETTTWTVTFLDGKTYRYQCDPHNTSMFGRFTVGNVPPPPPPAAAPARLSGKVGPGKAISLKTAAGGRVSSLKAARYRITVRDLTKADNFHLVGPGVNRKTRVGAKSTLVWTLSLRAGKYTYRSDATRRLRGSFVVR